jgi:hypothetical protein
MNKNKTVAWLVEEKNKMNSTPKAIEAFKKYIIARAKYGRCCNVNVRLAHLEMLEKDELIERGGCGTIEEITIKGFELFNAIT